MKHLDRRSFMVTTAAGLVVGCGASPENGKPSVDPGTNVDVYGDADLPITCGELTEPNIEGPFFSSGSPERSNLVEPTLEGVRLRLSGRVLAPDCTPLAGALLDFWQADDDGAYDEQGFTLRGHQRTDSQGRYELVTIVPGHYLNGAQYRPAHLHVKVGVPDFKRLTTQLYFEGDPYNDIDPFIRDSLIMRVTELDSGLRESRFDFVLAPA